MEVIPVEPTGWYGSFMVSNVINGKKVKVVTVDVFTYLCSACDEKHSYSANGCEHITAVIEHVEKKLDELASQTFPSSRD